MIRRGSGWVVAQFLLMATIIAAGVVSPEWPGEGRWLRIAVGMAFIVAGSAFALWASRTLGRAFTPFPKPNTMGLVTGGPFAVVRHPVYLGLLGGFVGYSLLAGVAPLVLTIVLAILWVGKSTVEERMLQEVYDEYPAYRARVRWQLIPFVY